MRNHGVEFHPEIVQQRGHVQSNISLRQILVAFQGVRSALRPESSFDFV
jgi:hypothetical protein